METLQEQLLRHEGLRLKPYKDTRGILTIGVGRNLEANGISRTEAMLMFHNDIDSVRAETDTVLPWVGSMPSEARQNVIYDMAFNMGIGGLLGFKRMLAAARVGNYAVAADEILDSKYARDGDTRGRAIELAEQMG